MDKPIVNQWHCDNNSCEGIFYIELDKVPTSCPYCKSEELSDSKMWELEKLSFTK